MSDDEPENVNRPNAKYKLSNQDSNVSGVGLTFHYNRERRLENAPLEVQNLYKTEQKKIKFGLFSALVADRPRRMLFFIIIFLCGLILILSALGFFDSSYMIDGNRIEVTGTIYESATIISLKKTVRNQGAYTGAIDIAVSPVIRDENEQYNVFTHRIFFTLENDEQYRFAVPFDSPELAVVIQNEKSALQFTFKPD